MFDNIKKSWLKIMVVVFVGLSPLLTNASALVDTADEIASWALTTVTELAGSTVWQFVFFFLGIFIFISIIAIIKGIIARRG